MKTSADALTVDGAIDFGVTIPDSYAAEMYERLGFVRLFATRTFAQGA